MLILNNSEDGPERLSPQERLGQWLSLLPERVQNKIALNNTDSLPAIWRKGCTGSKILTAQVSDNLDPNFTTVIGGICSIFTGDGERIRKRQETFARVSQFESWLRGWYPRLDQIHNTVGIPPKNAKQVIYVCEDSIWARRISRWTGLPVCELSGVLKNVHQERGEGILRRWLREGGYSGNNRDAVKVVYTSDLEPQLYAATAIWERLIGSRFDPRKLDQAAVNLMYTSLWLDVLGVKGKAVIYEDVCHGLEIEDFPQLRSWILNNPYGRDGMNCDLGVIGFLPFAGAHGMTRNMPFELVPNFSNWHNFKLNQDDAFYYSLNLFPANTLSRQAGNGLSYVEICKRAKFDIERIFS